MSGSSLRTPGVVVSAGTLSCVAVVTIAAQIALVRALSVDTYYHFAYLVIGAALLGFGAGGTALALVNRRDPAWWKHGVPILLAATAPLFGWAYRVSALLRPDVPFLLHSWIEVARLLATIIVLALPFVAAGTVTATLLYLHRNRPGFVYGANLISSGVGAALGLLLVSLAGGARALNWLAAAPAFSLVIWMIGAPESRVHSRHFILAVVALLGFPGSLAMREPGIVDRYKGLAHAELLVRQSSARPVARRFDAVSQVDLFDAPSMRHTLFASPLAAPAPEQFTLFLDGHLAGPVFAIQRPEEADVLAAVPQVLPYRVVDAQRVLLLGEVTGTNVWLALREGAREITVVQPHAALARIFGDLDLAPFSDPRVRTVTADPRTYLHRGDERYDLIQFVVAEGMPATTGGLSSFVEDHLLTREGVAAAYGLLAPGGAIVATRGLQNPPRDSIRLFALFHAALMDRGVPIPGERIVQGHNYLAATTIAFDRPLEEARVARIVAAAAEVSMDMDYRPGITALDLTERHRIAGPEGSPGSHLYHAAMAITGGEEEALYDRWPFLVRPPTDDRPFFHTFFRPSSLRSIVSVYGETWYRRVELGVVVVVVTLVLAAVAGSVLIALPLLVNFRRSRARNAGYTLWQAVHFSAIGAGFVLVEILMIQQLTRFLGSVELSTAVALTGLLTAAGAGSVFESRLALAPRRIVGIAAVATLVALPSVHHLLVYATPFAARLPLAGRAVAALFLMAPVAFPLGFQMPAGIRAAAAISPDHVPLCWAVNGVVSVVAAPAAVLIAVAFGYSGVAVAGAFCYGVVLAASLFLAS